MTATRSRTQSRARSRTRRAAKVDPPDAATSLESGEPDTEQLDALGVLPSDELEPEPDLPRIARLWPELAGEPLRLPDRDRDALPGYDQHDRPRWRGTS